MAELITQNPAETIKLWMRLSRLPFHLVGITPMLVGTLAASDYGFSINWFLAITAISAVVFIMLSTHFAGEYHDFKEDTLSLKYGKSNFAGGTSVIQEGKVNPKNVLFASNIAIACAIALGLFIQFYFKTGAWTIPLGVFGIIAGYFYSTPPLRWVKRGIGELLIALSYGFLPVLAASYLQTNLFFTELLYISTPIAISIFLVILINEFPDYRADKEADKRNLLVLTGKSVGAYIYIFASLLYCLSLVYLYHIEVFTSIIFLIPMTLSVVLSTLVGLKFYNNPKTLEAICGLTIAINLLTNIILIITLWV